MPRHLFSLNLWLIAAVVPVHLSRSSRKDSILSHAVGRTDAFSSSILPFLQGCQRAQDMMKSDLLKKRIQEKVILQEAERQNL